MKDKLKPCPKCNKSWLYVSDGDYYSDYESKGYRVNCSCGYAWKAISWQKTEQEAIQEWNRIVEMTDKEKQIEEMVNISTKEEIEARNKRGKEKDELRQALLHYATAEASGGIKSLIDCEGCAFYLYENLGYRKLHKDSVVLSREEYEQHANEYKNLSIKYDQVSDKYRLCKDANEGLKQKVISASKETAEKFLQLAYDRCSEKSFIKKVEEIAKQFGLEIKE